MEERQLKQMLGKMSKENKKLFLSYLRSLAGSETSSIPKPPFSSQLKEKKVL